MFGLLNVCKPPGPTSHDLVAQVRRRIGRGIRVGHAGTLDPFAEGVLVICIGPATRLADYVQRQLKRYEAEVVLGATSTTDDPEGRIVPAQGASPVGAEGVGAVLAGFVGTVEQAPPAYSAVHVDGRRAYKLARAGQRVAPAPRPVTIHAIDVLRYEYPRLVLDVRCGSGTYLRALARDVGAALGVGGYCGRLVRTEVGPFKLPGAVPPDRLDPPTHLLPPLAALAGMPRLDLTGEQARDVGCGRGIVSQAVLPPGEVALVGPDGQLAAIAVVQGDGRSLKPAKVFAPAG